MFFGPSFCWPCHSQHIALQVETESKNSKKKRSDQNHNTGYNTNVRKIETHKKHSDKDKFAQIKYFGNILKLFRCL